MDKIKLKGMGKYSDGLTIVSEIELSPSELKAQLKFDLRKLKLGDRIWVEGRLEKCQFFSYSKQDIVAIFPSETEKKRAELPEKINPNKYINAGMELAIAINQLIDCLEQMKEK